METDDISRRPIKYFIMFINMFSEITNKGEFNQEMYEFVFRFYIGRYYLKNVLKKKSISLTKVFLPFHALFFFIRRSIYTAHNRQMYITYCHIYVLVNIKLFDYFSECEDANGLCHDESETGWPLYIDGTVYNNCHCKIVRTQDGSVSIQKGCS